MCLEHYIVASQLMLKCVAGDPAHFKENQTDIIDIRIAKLQTIE